jgi:hypothetical protein
MGLIELGKVKTSGGTTYYVKWNPSDNCVYVYTNDSFLFGDSTFIAKANDGGEAMHKALAWAATIR